MTATHYEVWRWDDGDPRLSTPDGPEVDCGPVAWPGDPSGMPHARFEFMEDAARLLPSVKEEDPFGLEFRIVKVSHEIIEPEEVARG